MKNKEGRKCVETLKTNQQWILNRGCVCLGDLKELLISVQWAVGSHLSKSDPRF